MTGLIVASLIVQEPNGNTRTIDLRDGMSVRVGRLVEADLRLDDAGVSRSHAMFTASSSGVVVSDLSSTNGTYVNGKTISVPVDLQPSDVVDIGPFKLTINLASNESTKATVISGRAMTAQLKPTTTVVLVARIRAYREMRETLPEGDLTKFLTHWHQLVAKTVAAHGGKLDKSMDQVVIALWYGQPGSNVSESAVRAAQQIDLETRKFSVSGWPHHECFPLTCSIVLNTGLALMGSVGSQSGFRDFAVLGDTINVAFKIAESTEALAQSVLISQDVADQVAKAFRMSEVASVAPDAQSEPARVYAVQL